MIAPFLLNKLTLRQKLASYYLFKNVDSLPEWYVRQLERASSSDRIQMLRDRGIFELPNSTNV